LQFGNNPNTSGISFFKKFTSRYCLLLAQNLTSSSLLSINIKTKIYRTIILPDILYGHEIWSLALREKHTSKVSENRMLRKTLGNKGDEVNRGV
jgi:hypothetical protein